MSSCTLLFQLTVEPRQKTTQQPSPAAEFQIQESALNPSEWDPLSTVSDLRDFNFNFLSPCGL
jgi:hypothetical protein